MNPEFSIRTEAPSDVDAISEVQRLAFESDERIPDLINALRCAKTKLPTMSFVGCDVSGVVIGHVMLSHGWLDAPKSLVDVLVLSPLGVAPHAHHKGVGTALLAHAIEQAMQTAAPILFLEGNPKFYGPRGFEPANAFGIRSPSLRIPKPALQMVRLPSYHDELSGSLVYRDVFWEHDCVGLR